MVAAMSEPIGTEPKFVHVTPEQILREVEAVMKKYPGLAFITMIGLRGDATKLACLTNVSRDGTRERLRNGLKQMDQGRIRIPFRE